MFDSLPAANETAAATLDLQAEMARPGREGALPAPYRRAAIQDCIERALRTGLDLAGTTPTLLPDLLRAVSKEASRTAGDPFHALDNNPFIMREWLIVSQVLHTAAMTMEKRFEALFLGL